VALEAFSCIVHDEHFFPVAFFAQPFSSFAFRPVPLAPEGGSARALATASSRGKRSSRRRRRRRRRRRGRRRIVRIVVVVS